MEQKQSKQVTLVLEKEEVESSNVLPQNEKKESAKKVLFENNTPELYMANLKKGFLPTENEKKTEKILPKIEFQAEKTFVVQQEKKTEKVEEIQPTLQVQQEVLPQTQVQQEQEVEQVLEEEQTQEEILDDETQEEIQNDVSKKPKAKTRFRIFLFGLVGVLVCMMGWAISNAIQIKTLTAEIEQANKVYSVDIVKYIQNISKADDLTNPDSITNLDALSEAEIVPLQPTQSDPVEFSVKSNWFDRLCNWLSNLFN